MRRWLRSQKSRKFPWTTPFSPDPFSSFNDHARNLNQRFAIKTEAKEISEIEMQMCGN